MFASSSKALLYSHKIDQLHKIFYKQTFLKDNIPTKIKFFRQLSYLILTIFINLHKLPITVTRHDMTLKEYSHNFMGYTVPAILVDLLTFEKDHAIDDYYSESFELIVDDKFGLKTWSNEVDFLNQLLPFAQADNNGSFYAFWLYKNQDLNTAPIVVFGSEGGYHVVANNLLTLLRLLSLDVEPMVDEDGVYYYKDEENYEPSLYSRKFKKWLREYYFLSPISTNFVAEQLVEEAQDLYQELFLVWMASFIKKTYSYN